MVVPARQDRPNLPEGRCPFCVGGLEAPRPYQARAFSNRWPAMDGDRCEVVLYSPDHDASLGTLDRDQAGRVIDLWAERTEALGARADVAYVLVFENRGAAVGATIDHPHGQIYAYAGIPPVPARELNQTSCPLCAPPGPAELEVSRHGGWSTRVPWAPAWPYELLLSPDAHLADLPAVAGDAAARRGLAEALVDAAARLDGLFPESMPYMLWVHQRPTDGETWPAAHVHVHLCPILRAAGVPRYVAAAEQGGGVLFDPVDPVDAATRLRAARR
jgi:UDPglucose--hexose-1-phosphate uridylyltransferase